MSKINITMTTTKAKVFFSIKVAMLLVPTIVLASTIPAAIGIAAPSSNVSIVTSADSHGSVFFGQGAVQVFITDPNAKSGGGVTQSTIPVTVVAEAQNSKNVAANTYDVPETVLGSGKFEFYLTHHDSIFANGFAIHPVNAFGIARIANKSQSF